MKFEGFIKKGKYGCIEFYESDSYGDKELLLESEGEMLFSKLLKGNLGNNEMQIEITEDILNGEYILIKDPVYSFLIKESDLEGNIKSYFDKEGQLIHYFENVNEDGFVELPFNPEKEFTKCNIKIKYLGE